MRGALKVGAIAFVALLLVGLLLVAVGRWRESANRTRCQHHLGQVGLHALWSYTDPSGAFPAEASERAHWNRLPEFAAPDPKSVFPAGTAPNDRLPPEQRLSWAVLLMPYLRSDVSDRIDMSRGWDAETSADAIRVVVKQLICPSQFRGHDTSTPAPTHFLGMAGYGSDAPKLTQTDRRAGMFRYDDATRVGSVQRGFSNTISFLETGRETGPWAAGGPPTVRGFNPDASPIGEAAQFGGHHPGGANAAFVDGSVRFLSSQISPRILAKLVMLAEHDDD